MNDDTDQQSMESLIEIAQHTDRVISWTLFRVLLWFWWPW